MTAENRDPSRLYGRASTFEGRRAVPSPEVRDRLAEQRERLMSKNTKVGKTHYEAGRPTMTADGTVTAKFAEWEALAEGATEGPWEAVGDGDPYLRRGDVATRGEPGDRFIVCELAGPDAEFIAAAPTIARALLGFVREVTEGHEPDAEGRYCGECASNAHGNTLVPWPCPTAQAAQKWIGGEG